MSHYFMAHNMKRESWGIALQFGIPRGGGGKKGKKLGGDERANIPRRRGARR